MKWLLKKVTRLLCRWTQFGRRFQNSVGATGKEAIAPILIAEPSANKPDGTNVTASPNPQQESGNEHTTIQQEIRGDSNATVGKVKVSGDRSAVFGNVARDVNIYRDSSPPVGVPFQALSLSPYFVERPEISQALKQCLLAKTTSKSGTLAISAIHGMGGLGKTTLAIALAHDEEVRTRFCDGVLWATLGQEPDLLSLLNTWVSGLGNHDFKPTTAEAASAYLRTLLCDKAVLLIVDDAWNPEHVEPFQVGSSSCRLLITTRRVDVADEVGAELYQLDLMTPEQSLALLSNRLKLNLDGTERKEAELLAEAVGFLPIALNLIAVRVARGIPWSELRSALEEEVARLEAFDSPRHRRKGETGLEASFNLSLKALREDDPEVWQNFVWLGVLPEEALVAAPMAATLWEVDKAKADERLEWLCNDALLLSGSSTSVRERTWRTYRVHDLLHDFARRLLEPNPPLGLGFSFAEAQIELLKRYQAHTQDCWWHTLPDDGYIHIHLTWHLEKARWVDELHKLLREETKEGHNGWYQVCDRFGQIAGYLTAVNRAWHLTEEAFNICPSLALSLQCRYALITASLTDLATNIPVAIMAALVEKKLWTPAQCLVYARQSQNLQQKMEILIKLASHSPDVLSEALEAALTIQNENERAFALNELAPHLPTALLPEALEAALAIQNKSQRVQALIGLTPYLPEALLLEALEAALGIVSERPKTQLPEAPEATQAIKTESRVQALIKLAPYLPEVLLPKALEAALTIQNESDQAQVLTGLAPYLTQDLLLRALEAAAGIYRSRDRVQALKGLAPYLPKDLLAEALEVALKIRDESQDESDDERRYASYQIQALNGLAPHLPKVLLMKALEEVLEMPAESDRTQALIGLVPHLPEDLLSKTLQAAQAIQSESDRVQALTGLVPYLPKVLLPEAWRAVQKIEDTSNRTQVLIGFAPHFSKAELIKTLRAVQDIEKESDRVKTLIGLIPHLPKSLLQETLKAAQTIRDENYRTQVLTKLIPRLPKDSLQEPLRAARTIQDESYRTQFLTELAPNLPEALLPEAFRVVQNIWNEVYRTQALTRLVPYLPETLLPEALRVAQDIGDKNYRTQILTKLAPCLPEVLLRDALNVTRVIQDRECQDQALTKLTPYLPESLPRTLRKTRIQDEKYRARNLGLLAIHLPDVLLPEALEVARAIKSETYRTQALLGLVPHLPDNLLPEALEAARAIQSKNYRVQALLGLASHIPEALSEALAAARAIKFEYERVQALNQVALHSPEVSLSEALEAARAIESESYRTQALSQLVSHLPEPELWWEVLRGTRAITSASYRVQVLSRLAVNSPEWFLLEVLKVVKGDRNEGCRTQALMGLMLRSPKSLQKEILAVGREIMSDKYQAQALRGLMSYLPNALLPEALRVALAIQHDGYRVQALSQVGRHLVKLPLANLYPLWSETLHNLVRRSRKALLLALPEFIHVIVFLDGSQAVVDIVRVIQDVGRQWR